MNGVFASYHSKIEFMIPIRIECECGQPYAFEIEPVNGRMPVPVACPTCGRDGTAAANAVIARSLAAPAPSAPAAPAQGEGSQPEGLVDLDFVSTFPQVFWVSSVGRDAKAPRGFRYKLLTMRREPEMDIDIIFLREMVDGKKEVLSAKRGPLSTFGMLNGTVEQLGKDKEMTFERFDFSNVRSFEEFRARALEAGWESYKSA
jgi:hypothetical protein